MCDGVYNTQQAVLILLESVWNSTIHTILTESVFQYSDNRFDHGRGGLKELLTYKTAFLTFYHRGAYVNMVCLITTDDVHACISSNVHDDSTKRA